MVQTNRWARITEKASIFYTAIFYTVSGKKDIKMYFVISSTKLGLF